MIAKILVILVILIELYLVVTEMFLWRTLGRRTFALSEAFAAGSRVMAANLGLYNLFLIIGLLWGLSFGTSGELTRMFFLAFVTLAGIFGGATIGWRVFLIQGLPGLLALLATWYRI